MKEQNQTKSTNIKWHNLTIDREKLEKMRGHKGMVIWFTGLSGSGKSTSVSYTHLTLPTMDHV